MVSSTPLVTIVIPSYNHAHYVAQAVESLFQQTFRDFEVIIIDDGSTDGSPEVISSALERNPGVTVHFHVQKNRGLSATLNRGIELAGGEFFCFLPSDDMYQPEKLEHQVKAFREGGSDLGIVFTRQMVVDDEGNEVTDSPILNWFDVPFRTKEEIFPALFERNFLPAPSVMCRMSYFDRVGTFDESINYCQDYDMWLRMLKFGDIGLVDKRLIKYRWHGRNLTYTKSERADFERAVVLLKATRNLSITDVFPRLKGLDQSDFPQEYSEAYRTLSRYLLNSGLYELVPVAYSMIEQARRLTPSLEIDDEIQELLRKRPHFLELRDGRLGELNEEASSLRFRLNRLHQVEEDLNHKAEMVEDRQRDLENRQKLIEENEEKIKTILDVEEKIKTNAAKEAELKEWTERLEKKGKEIEERETAFADVARQQNERHLFLQEWQNQVQLSQAKFDLFVSRPHIKVLRFTYRRLKSVWTLLPETIKKPIRVRLKGKLLPMQVDQVETEAVSGNQPETEADRRPSRPNSYLVACDPSSVAARLRLAGIKQPKVTVVLPVYNQSYLLEEALGSILSQTYPNIELIVVNDGSTDRVNDILPRYGFHEKVTVLNQQNQGLPRALTNGFRQATGAFLSWTSADNILLPNQIETLVDFLLRHPEVDMAYSDVEIIDEAGAPVLHSDYRKHNQNPPGSNRLRLPDEVETLGLIPDNFINASFLYRSTVGKVIGEYDPCLLGTEDYDYWLRINSLFSIEHIDSDEVLYRYRVHKDSLSDRFGESDIFENAGRLISYNKERERYYGAKFDVVLVGDTGRIEEERYLRLADEFRNMGHNVIRCVLNPGRAGTKTRREGMIRLFVGNEQPETIREKIVGVRQHPKALLIFAGYADQRLMEALKGEDTFSFLDVRTAEEAANPSLELVDGVSTKSRALLNALNERHKTNSYLIGDGVRGGKIFKKARDNFYRPYEYPLNNGLIALYYGPLKRAMFDGDLFREIVDRKKNWIFVLIGKQGSVENDLVAELKGLRNVYYVGRKPGDESGNLYQNLSHVAAVWAPLKRSVLADGSHEDTVEELIEIAGLAGRPLIIGDAVDVSDIPFVFPFHDAAALSHLLDLCPQLGIDRNVSDRWLGKNDWAEAAKWFPAIANNRLFYRKTREPIKKERKIPSVAPEVYRPDEGKINVLVQVRSLDKGGLEEVVLNLLRHFDYRRVNVLVLCEERGGDVADRCRRMGIMVKTFRGEEEYRNILEKYSIDVVNYHYASFGMNIAHEMGIPVIPVIHNTYVWFDRDEIDRFKACDPYVSHYVCVSENVGRYLTQRFGIGREKVRVIPNGLDVDKLGEMETTERKAVRTKLGIEDDDYVFLNVATFDGRKGHNALVGAMRKIGEGYSKLKVVCVGNIAAPAYYAQLEENIRSYGLEGRVILHDYVEDVSSFYRCADAFLLPSLIEGWSISVMEAMYFNLPLILTDVGGNAEIVRDTGNGIVLPTSYGNLFKLDRDDFGKYCGEEAPANTEAIAEAMRDFYDRKDYWRERGEQGGAAVRERYRIEKTVRAYEELFTDETTHRPR